jgi:hypothetical protein
LYIDSENILYYCKDVDMKKIVLKKRKKVLSVYQKPRILLLVILFIMMIVTVLGIKYRLSVQGNAWFDFPNLFIKPLPTINLKINGNLPTLPPLHITLPPIHRIGVPNDIDMNNQMPQIPSPDEVKANPNDFFNYILPIVKDIPLDYIVNGIFTLIGGKNDNSSTPDKPPIIINSPSPKSSNPAIPSPTKSSQIPSGPTKIPPPTSSPLNGKINCTRRVVGTFTGCMGPFCGNQDVNETITECVEKSNCTVPACNRKVIADANGTAKSKGATINWQKSSFTCTITIGTSCN